MPKKHVYKSKISRKINKKKYKSNGRSKKNLRNKTNKKSSKRRMSRKKIRRKITKKKGGAAAGNNPELFIGSEVDESLEKIYFKCNNQIYIFNGNEFVLHQYGFNPVLKHKITEIIKKNRNDAYYDASPIGEEYDFIITINSGEKIFMKFDDSKYNVETEFIDKVFYTDFSFENIQKKKLFDFSKFEMDKLKECPSDPIGNNFFKELEDFLTRNLNLYEIPVSRGNRIEMYNTSEKSEVKGIQKFQYIDDNYVELLGSEDSPIQLYKINLESEIIERVPSVSLRNQHTTHQEEIEVLPPHTLPNFIPDKKKIIPFKDFQLRNKKEVIEGINNEDLKPTTPLYKEIIISYLQYLIFDKYYDSYNLYLCQNRLYAEVKMFKIKIPFYFNLKNDRILRKSQDCLMKNKKIKISEMKQNTKIINKNESMIQIILIDEFGTIYTNEEITEEQEKLYDKVVEKPPMIFKENNKIANKLHNLNLHSLINDMVKKEINYQKNKDKKPTNENSMSNSGSSSDYINRIFIFENQLYIETDSYDKQYYKIYKNQYARDPRTFQNSRYQYFILSLPININPTEVEEVSKMYFNNLGQESEKELYIITDKNRKYTLNDEEVIISNPNLIAQNKIYDKSEKTTKLNLENILNQGRESIYNSF